MRRIDLIVIHCTASRPDQHITMEQLDKMHKARGWKCCGYHYYITEMVGAHARHYNAHSIGVCYEGGLDEKGRPADTRTPAQKLALHTLLVSLKADFPDAEIMGHCELEGVHKACPCFPVSTIRAQMKQLGY